MSSSSGNRLPSATVGGASAKSTPASADNTWGGARRRSSASNQGLFSGLMNQKRNSADASAAARKASFDEQKTAPGFVGQMWNNFVKGAGPSGASKSGSEPGAK
ncbi:MAG: hypothetical protein M1817_004428 [Caeruleum heppii]|nr:MAG: hypothetical protein M1817_004428 [Caeruleum heppii]